MATQYERIESVKDVVMALLVKHPETRDNDRLLILKVWAFQYPELRDKETRFREFSNLFLAGKLVDTESIRRSRQKVQEKHPTLKGEAKEIRKEYEEEVRSNINKESESC